MNALTASDLAPLALPGFSNAWIIMAFHFLPMPIMWVAKIGGKQRKCSPSAGRGDTVSWASWISLYLLSIFTPIRAVGGWMAIGALLTGAGLFSYAAVISSFFKSGAGEKLMDGGLYRFSRHPMYVAQAVFMAGMCMLTASLPFILLSLYAAIRQLRGAVDEETLCASRLGEAYTTYMERTPRWFGFPDKSGR